MRYVLDASIAVKWVIPEPDSAKALALRDDFRNQIHDLIAPDTFPVEVAHALTRAERRGRPGSLEGAQLLEPGDRPAGLVHGVLPVFHILFQHRAPRRRSLAKRLAGRYALQLRKCHETYALQHDLPLIRRTTMRGTRQPNYVPLLRRSICRFLLGARCSCVAPTGIVPNAPICPSGLSVTCTSRELRTATKAAMNDRIRIFLCPLLVTAWLLISYDCGSASAQQAKWPNPGDGSTVERSNGFVIRGRVVAMSAKEIRINNGRAILKLEGSEVHSVQTDSDTFSWDENAKSFVREKRTATKQARQMNPEGGRPLPNPRNEVKGPEPAVPVAQGAKFAVIPVEVENRAQDRQKPRDPVAVQGAWVSQSWPSAQPKSEDMRVVTDDTSNTVNQSVSLFNYSVLMLTTLFAAVIGGLIPLVSTKSVAGSIIGVLIGAPLGFVAGLVLLVILYLAAFVGIVWAVVIVFGGTGACGCCACCCCCR